MSNNQEMFRAAQFMIRAQLNSRFEKLEKPPTFEELKKSAEEARKLVMPMYAFSDEEFAEVLEWLDGIFTTCMEEMSGFITDNGDWYRWLNDEEENINWHLFERYIEYLGSGKGWPIDVIRNLETTSRDVLNLVGNPRQPEPFLRRGLIIGDVQSGKTATYTAICARAADAGYNVIVVLTGMQEDLRRQTQRRLDEELIGKNNNGEAYPISQYNRHNVNYRKLIDSCTAEEFDFGKECFKRVNDLQVFNERTSLLFVCKKNRDVLEPLNKKFADLEDENNKKIDKSILIIDDEADNASVNTKKEEDDPTAINACIRNIMNHFTKSSYVGVTATPFANIFIRPDLPPCGVDAERLSDDDMYRDLFPNDFIYVLGYPDTYIGAKGIFGEENSEDENSGKYSYMLERIDQNEIECLFPTGHNKDFKPEKLPNDLYKAMRYFILTIAVRNLRGDDKKHKTMLINISRLISDHEEIGNIVNDWLTKVKREVKSYAGLSVEEAENNSAEIGELHDVFRNMNVEEMAGISWHELQHNYLKSAASRVEVYVQNSDKKNKKLNYGEYDRNGLCAIVIGGNSLSRGLTLEGLCVSYFYRNTKFYDTLMQMGRWFGYRPKYDDLCRIWLTEAAVVNYTNAYEAIEGLKELIYTMNDSDFAPRDFGLRVREDPNSVMMITARNKMLAADVVDVPVDICAKFIDASRIKYDKDTFETIKSNNELILNFLDRLPAPTADDYDVIRPKYFWRGIGKERVANLIRSLKTSRMNYKFQPEAIADYIENEMGDVLWDVAVPGNNALNGADADFIEVSINKKKTKIKPRSYATILDGETGNKQVVLGGIHSRITYPALGKIGLSKEEAKEIEDRAPISIKTGKRKVVSASGYMNKNRRPLLLIYLINPKHDESIELPDLICTIGVGFPDNGNKNRTVRYRLNAVAIRQEYDEDGVE